MAGPENFFRVSSLAERVPPTNNGPLQIGISLAFVWFRGGSMLTATGTPACTSLLLFCPGGHDFRHRLELRNWALSVV